MGKRDRKNQKKQNTSLKVIKKEEDLPKLINTSQTLTAFEKETLIRQYKSHKETRVVLFAAFNDLDILPIANNFRTLISQGQILTGDTSVMTDLQDPSTQVQFFNPDSSSQTLHEILTATKETIGNQVNNEKYVVIAAPRDYLSFMDYAKIADCIVVCVSCEHIDLQHFKLDPENYSGSYDELGLLMISGLRAQGYGNVIGGLCGLEKITKSEKQTQVKSLFKRFLESEFDNIKILNLDNKDSYLKLLFEVQWLQRLHVAWRDTRGYFLAEKLGFDKENSCLDIQGVVSGSGFSSGELVHITGVGDFPIEQVMGS